MRGVFPLVDYPHTRIRRRLSGSVPQSNLVKRNIHSSKDLAGLHCLASVYTEPVFGYDSANPDANFPVVAYKAAAGIPLVVAVFSLSIASSTVGVKAVVKRKCPCIPVFRQFIYTVTYLKTKNIHAVQRQYQLGASIRPLKSLHAACADKA